MGRHDAVHRSRWAPRVTAPTVPTVPTVSIVVLVLAAIGFAVWLGSVRSVVDPIDAKPVDAYAVVVSSPTCTSGSGSTVIDLNIRPVVRSSLSGCGQPVGAQLAVQYLDGHPDQVRLAGTTVAHSSTLARWLPIAIVAAGLLAVIATITLLVERRQSRHSGQRGSRVTVAQLRAPEPEIPGPETPVPVAMPGAGPPVWVPDAEPTASVEPTAAAGPTSPDLTSRIAVGAAGAASRPFRAGGITALPDLFTHRGPQAPDR